jgi:protein phosphatase
MATFTCGSASGTILNAGACTAPGHRRLLNEDAWICGPTWFAVADGMAGHPSGAAASAIAIDVLREHPAPSTLEEIGTAIDDANTRIRAAAHRDATTGMGTTLVLAAGLDDGVAVGHIGDSRCYQLVGGALRLVTHDHSHVQELVDLGRITAEAAGRHRLRHVVTRALGVDGVARAELVHLPQPVGRLLLCSDGLTAELSSRTIGRVLSGVGDAQVAAERLVELALGGEARDNLTAIVVDAPHGRS